MRQYIRFIGDNSDLFRSLMLVTGFFCFLTLPFFLVGCNGEEYGIKSLVAKSESGELVTKAELDEKIFIVWRYKDGSNPKKQSLTFFKHTFGDPIEDKKILNINDRDYEISTFEQPVTVLLEMKDKDDKTYKASITIGLEQNFNFKVDTVHASDPLYPYLGNTFMIINGGCSGSKVTIARNTQIDFTKFIAFYDYNDNGHIDGFTNLFQNMEVDNATSQVFRALSYNDKEEDRFGFKQGIAYPFNVIGNPQSGYSNTIIFGTTIITDGKERCEEGEKGQLYCYSIDVTRVETIFMTIIYWIPQTSTNAQGSLIDIQLGNLTQGLIDNLKYNAWPMDTREPTTSLTWNNKGTPSGTIQGTLKGGIVVWNVTKKDGTNFRSIVGIPNAEFLVPFYPDTYVDPFSN